MKMVGPSPGDKRIAQRVPVRIHIRFRLLKSPSGEKPEAELHNGNNIMSNISRTGFFLSTKNFLDIQSVIEVEFPLEEFKEVLRVESEVVRANYQNFPNQGRYEYGLRFTAMHPHFREVMEKFLMIAGG
jgi:hypothetical protein